MNKSPLASLRAGKGQSMVSLWGLNQGSGVKPDGGGGFTTPVPASGTFPQTSERITAISKGKGPWRRHK